MLDLSRESSFRDSLGSRSSLAGVLGRKSLINITLRSLNDVPEESDESAEAAKLALQGAFVSFDSPTRLPILVG